VTGSRVTFFSSKPWVYLLKDGEPAGTFGESVGGYFEMDSSDWSNGIRYHIFVTRSDTESKRMGATLKFAGSMYGIIRLCSSLHPGLSIYAFVSR
jgi:hypothetical protein